MQESSPNVKAEYVEVPNPLSIRIVKRNLDAYLDDKDTSFGKWIDDLGFKISEFEFSEIDLICDKISNKKDFNEKELQFLFSKWIKEEYAFYDKMDFYDVNTKHIVLFPYSVLDTLFYTKDKYLQYIYYNYYETEINRYATVNKNLFTVNVAFSKEEDFSISRLDEVRRYYDYLLFLFQIHPLRHNRLLLIEEFFNPSFFTPEFVKRVVDAIPLVESLDKNASFKLGSDYLKNFINNVNQSSETIMMNHSLLFLFFKSLFSLGTTNKKIKELSKYFIDVRNKEKDNSFALLLTVLYHQISVYEEVVDSEVADFSQKLTGFSGMQIQ